MKVTRKTKQKNKKGTPSIPTAWYYQYPIAPYSLLDRNCTGQNFIHYTPLGGGEEEYSI